MNHIDYGFSIFNKKAFVNLQPKEYLDLGDLVESLVNAKKMVGYEVKNRFFEIGSFQGLEEFEEFLEGIN